MFPPIDWYSELFFCCSGSADYGFLASTYPSFSIVCWRVWWWVCLCWRGKVIWRLWEALGSTNLLFDVLEHFFGADRGSCTAVAGCKDEASFPEDGFCWWPAFASRSLLFTSLIPDCGTTRRPFLSFSLSYVDEGFLCAKVVCICWGLLKLMFSLLLLLSDYLACSSTWGRLRPWPVAETDRSLIFFLSCACIGFMAPIEFDSRGCWASLLVLGGKYDDILIDFASCGRFCSIILGWARCGGFWAASMWLAAGICP